MLPAFMECGGLTPLDARASPRTPKKHYAAMAETMIKADFFISFRQPIYRFVGVFIVLSLQPNHPQYHSFFKS